MVDAHEVEHGRVQVVDLDRVLDGSVSEFVGGAVGPAASNAAAGKPHAEAELVVVASVRSLAERRATELATPDHEGRFEQASTLEVAEQRRDRLVDRAGVVLVALLQLPVLVPAITTDLRAGAFHESNAPLDQPAGEQAFAGVDAGRSVVALEPVLPSRLLGLVVDVGRLGHRELHAEGEFLVEDRALDAVAAGRTKAAVEGLDQTELATLSIDLLAGSDVGEDLLGRAKHGTLVGRGEEGVAEALETTRRDEAAVEDDEAGKVAILAPEAVGRPRAHGGASGEAESGVEEVVGVGVLVEGRGHRSDDQQLVGHLAHVREEIGDRRAAGATRPEFPRRAHAVAVRVELGRRLLHREGLSVSVGQDGLRIEGVHLPRTAVHVEKDDAAGPRGMVRRRKHAAGAHSVRTRIDGPRLVAERSERRETEASGQLPEHLASTRGSGLESTAVMVAFAHGDRFSRGG